MVYGNGISRAEGRTAELAYYGKWDTPLERMVTASNESRLRTSEGGSNGLCLRSGYTMPVRWPQL